MKTELKTLVFAMMFFLLFSSKTMAQGVLDGSWAEGTAGHVNLTEEGTLDWFQVGYGGDWDNPGEFNHKAGVTPMITYELIQNTPDPEGGTGELWYDDEFGNTYSWTDGTPTASADSNETGWWVPGETNGFTFTAPADQTDKTLNLYIGGWASFGDISATLSDGSAPDLLNQEFIGTEDGDIKKFTINYKAGSTGQTLTITWITAQDNGGGWGNVTVRAATLSGTVTGVDDKKSGIPDMYELRQNYPNPFNPNTKIIYLIPEQSHVRLNVYDLLGNEVAKLVDGIKAVGSYEVYFDGANLSSGVYLYHFQAGQFSSLRKMILLR
jgi:hypothetical protein